MNQLLPTWAQDHILPPNGVQDFVRSQMIDYHSTKQALAERIGAFQLTPPFAPVEEVAAMRVRGLSWWHGSGCVQTRAAHHLRAPRHAGLGECERVWRKKRPIGQQGNTEVTRENLMIPFI